MTSTPAKLIYILLTFFTLTSIARSQECLKISYWNFDVKEVEIAKQMISEVYNQLNLCHQFINMPPNRSIEALMRNEVQAHLWRTAEFLNFHANDQFNALPEPIIKTSISIFYDSKQLKAFDLNHSLQGRAIGTVLGSYQGQKLIAKLDAKPIPVTNYHRLYRLLKSKRVCAVIMPSELYHAYSREIGASADIKEVALYDTNIYHVVGKSQKHLIPKLNEALIAVKKEASFFDRLQATN